MHLQKNTGAIQLLQLEFNEILTLGTNIKSCYAIK